MAGLVAVSLCAGALLKGLQGGTADEPLAAFSALEGGVPKFLVWFKFVPKYVLVHIGSRTNWGVPFRLCSMPFGGSALANIMFWTIRPWQ